MLEESVLRRSTLTKTTLCFAGKSTANGRSRAPLAQWNSGLEHRDGNGDGAGGGVDGGAGIVGGGADDEASLITESSPVSPPFVRAPAEDRSKYEKLAFNADEVSSDSDNNKGVVVKERAKKPKRGRVKNVLSRKRRVAHDVDNANTVEYESDDSIGSASDLRAMNDEEGNQDDENDGERERTIDETVSESVRTCGSSAYHAECESVATHEDDYRMKRPKRHYREQQQQQLPTIDADPIVGHQYGEKPLLLDDELDPESKPEQSHGDPFVRHQYGSKPLLFNGDSSSDDNERSKSLNNGIWKLEDDVFAMAPFPRSSSSRKSSDSRGSESKNADLASGRNSPSHNSSLVTPISSSPVPAPTEVFVDVDAGKAMTPKAVLSCIQYPKSIGVAVVGNKAIYEEPPPASFHQQPVQTSPSVKSSPHCVGIAEEEEEDENVEKDLFGSSPFSPSGFTNPFNNVQPGYASIDPAPVQPVMSAILSSPASAYLVDYANVPLQRPPHNPADVYYVSASAAAHPSTVASASKFGMVTVNQSEPSVPVGADTSKDLFGSIPFEEFASLKITEQQRPTSLALPQTHSANYVVDSVTLTTGATSGGASSVQSPNSVVHLTPTPPSSATSQQVTYTIQPTTHTARITVHAVNSVSKVDIASDMISPMSPEPLVGPADEDTPKHKRDKAKSDRSKYHLISENHGDIVNVLPSKVSHKTKSASHKKTPKGKRSTAATAGFSNMSFEDFPSDENEEKQVARTKVTPFEVIREQSEKRFGSLKRRSNPFT